MNGVFWEVPVSSRPYDLLHMLQDSGIGASIGCFYCGGPTLQMMWLSLVVGYMHSVLYIRHVDIALDIAIVFIQRSQRKSP